MKPTRSPSPLSTQPTVWKNETRSRTKSSTDTLTAEIDVLYSQPPDFVSIRNDPFRLNNANAIDKQDSCCVNLDFNDIDQLPATPRSDITLRKQSSLKHLFMSAKLSDAIIEIGTSITPPPPSTPTKPPKKDHQPKQKHLHTITNKLVQISAHYKTLAQKAIVNRDPASAILNYTKAIEICLHPSYQQIIQYDKVHSKPEYILQQLRLKFAFYGLCQVPDPVPIAPDQSLFCDRASAKLSLHDFYGAVDDCDMVLERVLESTGLKTSLDGNTDKEILRTAIFRRGMARQNLQDYSGALRDYHSTMDSFKADNEQSSVLSIQDVERKIRTAQRMQAQTEYDKKLVSYMYNTQSCKERPTKSNNLFTLANDSDSEDEAITTTHQIRNLLLSHLTKIITSIESHHEDTLQQDWTPNSIGILDPDTIHTTNALSKLLRLSPTSTRPPIQTMFRLLHGYTLLLKKDLISPSSIHILLPLLTSSLPTTSPSPNTLTLSQTSSLTDILAAALESTQNFDPTQEMSPFLLPHAFRLVSACFSDEACLDAVVEAGRGGRGAVETWRVWMAVVIETVDGALRECRGVWRVNEYDSRVRKVVPVVVTDGWMILCKGLEFGVQIVVEEWGLSCKRVVGLMKGWLEVLDGCMNGDGVVRCICEGLREILREEATMRGRSEFVDRNDWEPIRNILEELSVTEKTLVVVEECLELMDLD